ncbi:MAG: leucine-rich repeat domain-containing protein [Oscillospiraceae bacterium]|nr:leucine-rich repeat domain-containing protein [Oscillospiraceae bacterium]
MKKTTIRKITAALLCALLLLSAPMGMNLPGGFALTASAQSYSGTCGENLTWTLNTTTGLLAITGTGAMWDYSSSSNAPWYSNRSSIREVQIANGVTSIGDWAFDECTSLTSVTIGDSVTSIGVDAFSECTSLTSVTIGDSVTSIGDCAFYWCTSLTSVTIPDSVTSIGKYAFYSCTSLTSVTIPDSVTSIGEHAFTGCFRLTSVTIPDSVTSIGDDAFSGCTSLTSITVKEGNPKYSSDEYGVLLNKGKTLLIQYPVGNTRTSYTIPDSVTSIGDVAFCACTSLTSVTIPDSVTSIGYSAFYECTSLTSVTIGDSVTSIGYWVFAYCSSLNYVHIPDSVTDIGESILMWSPAYICSDTETCYAKEYAEAKGIEFRVCDGHGAAEPEPPKFDGTTGTVQADCTPGCFDEDAHLVVSESDKTLPEFGITVSGYVQVQKTYNIQVQNAHGQPLQPKSGHTVTLRLPLPLDDHGNPYDAGKYSVYHLIDNDPANTESFRAKKGNLKIENGFLVIEVSHFSPFVVVVESEMPTVSIAGNPGTFTLRYNETLVLHAEAENLPDGASLLWEADKDGIVELKPSGDGTTCEIISKKTGDVRITVKVVDADGSEIEGSGSDTETVQSKAGFFQKLLAFFRLLFGIKVRIDQRKK